MKKLTLTAFFACLLLITGCSDKDAQEQAPGEEQKATAEEQKATAEDITIDESTFGCITDMTKVNQMYVSNLLGDTEGTVEAAQKGGVFPVGSALRLIPDEIMVKGKPGSRPTTGDWMFVRLDYDKETGKQKVTTGFETVTNFLNLTCFSCHVVAGAEHDFVCGDKEGNKNCADIPFDRPMLHALQNTDPRCGEKEVSAEDAEALAKLQKVVEEILNKQPLAHCASALVLA